jgi:selenocysteine lyase/cysteine desulfurase
VTLPHAEHVGGWRAETPGCARVNHLNNAGASLMPQPVIDAIVEHLKLESEIGGYEAADAREGMLEVAYHDLARLIGAKRENIAVVGSATAGFVQALSSFDFEPGDAIVTTKCDYTSNQIQYLSLAQRAGVVVLRAEDRPEGGVDPDSVRDLVKRNRVRLVAVSWVPTNSGLVQDAESVGLVCDEMGISYVVDACQAIGQIPIDVARLRCDYLSVTARKFLRGPRGIGFMYASDRALQRGDHPLFIDMHGAKWVAPDAFEMARTAQRYEEWERPHALMLGLGAAARYALDVGIDVAQERAFALARRVREGLSSITSVRVLDRGQDPCAIVTAAVGVLDANEVVSALSARGINTTASQGWYGLIDFAEKHVGSALRVSPHYFNTEDEVDSLVAAVGEIAGAATGSSSSGARRPAVARQR